MRAPARGTAFAELAAAAEGAAVQPAVTVHRHPLARVLSHVHRSLNAAKVREQTGDPHIASCAHTLSCATPSELAERPPLCGLRERALLFGPLRAQNVASQVPVFRVWRTRGG